MRMRPRAGSTRGQPGRAGRSTEQRRCTGRSEPPWLVALPACPPRGRPAPEELVARCNEVHSFQARRSQEDQDRGRRVLSALWHSRRPKRPDEPPSVEPLPACPPPGRQAPMGLELRAPHRLLDTTAARSGPRSKRKWKRERCIES